VFLDDDLMNITTEQLFTHARTAGGFLPTPVPDATLRELYELTKWGPTSANCGPARIVFVRSPEAKAKLLTCVSPGNVRKASEAPVTAIIGMDMAFYEHLPRLYRQADARSWFVGNEAKIADTAVKNSSMQGGYFILAARALGLDCGPMGGFSQSRMDEAFWAGTTVRTNFICTLGHADPAKQEPRNPRLTFDEACSLV
jgi:3-hydroxypropanoate dehydrogenase